MATSETYLNGVIPNSLSAEENTSLLGRGGAAQSLNPYWINYVGSSTLMLDPLSGSDFTVRVPPSN